MKNEVACARNHHIVSKQSILKWGICFLAMEVFQDEWNHSHSILPNAKTKLGFLSEERISLEFNLTYLGGGFVLALPKN